jgi:hypothetical protein
VGSLLLMPKACDALIYPPPLSEIDKQDRFGFPLLPPTALTDTEEQRRAREAEIGKLTVELFATAVTYLGRPQAKRLFGKVTKQNPKGKQANRERNRDLLKRYHAELAKGHRSAEALHRVAKALHRLNPLKQESVKRHLRRLIREERQRWEQESRALATIASAIPSRLSTDI